jgi:hypothetical protein
MPGPIPWKAKAAICVKRRTAADFEPVIAGISLNEAIEYVADPDRPTTLKFAILVQWGAEERTLSQKLILQLASHPERPLLPPDYTPPRLLGGK